MSFGNPNAQKSPLRTTKYFCEEFLNFKHIIDFFHLNIFPTAIAYICVMTQIEIGNDFKLCRHRLEF